MGATWIVSANASRARIFSQENSRSPLQEINDMVNTAARLRAAEIETDDLGQRSASKSRHSVGAPTPPSGYEPKQLPAEHQTELFARNIASFLLQAHQEHRFAQLHLVASPEFLGVLRKLLAPELASAVQLQIHKDYSRLNGEQLREQIEAVEAKGDDK